MEKTALTYEEYYGDSLSLLKQIEAHLLELVRQYPARGYPDGVEPILYCKSRIKQPESIIRKLEQRGFSTDVESALSNVHDAVGVRVVCSFVDDVYKVAQWLSTNEEFIIVEAKDYIAYPKPNGYHSLHLVLSFPSFVGRKIKAEIQLRTIAIDFWAALEHQLKYKKEHRTRKNRAE